MARPTTFAAVGDVHGHMHQMVALLAGWEQAHRRSLDFVLQVGDFEPHRDLDDVASMAAPAKYRELGDFPAFVDGRASFPWPVVFIGGNHEPYGALDRHPDGYELVPGCRYLGRAGVVELAGLRVGGLSGIYRDGRFEQPRPRVEDIDRRSNKDYIHFTAADVGRVLDAAPLDVLLLHEWPADIVAPEHAADFEQQRRSMRYDCVGSEQARLLVDLLEPRLVLCGHMHRRYRRRLAGTQIACLAHVMAGADALAVFEAGPDGAITELELARRAARSRS